MTTPDELNEHLREQMGFMRTSSRLYDEGDEAEAKRLALAVRILVHDTGQSHSILGQLGVKATLQYWSTPLAPPSQPGGSYVGIQMLFGVEAGKTVFIYKPNLRPPERRLPFDDWWDNEPLIVQGAERVTRKRAVLAMANKDGGAHVDPALAAIDHQLLKTDLMGWKLIPGTPAPTRPIGSPSLAVVRTVAHELENTILECLGHIVSR